MGTVNDAVSHAGPERHPGIEALERERIMSTNTFDRLMGDCAGVDIMTVTEDDIRAHVTIWNEQEPGSVSEDEIREAIAGLSEYQEQERIKKAASALGRKGGSAKTEAKATTARENGRKGGRPKKHETAT